jgi:fatty acid desaturase
MSSDRNADRGLRDKTWIDDPLIIFQNYALIPSYGMTEAERLNAITRLIIVITVVLFFIPIASWWIFFLLGLGLVVVLYLTSKNKNDRVVENYRCFYRLRRNSKTTRAKTQPSTIPEEKVEKRYINLKPRL